MKESGACFTIESILVVMANNSDYRARIAIASMLGFAKTRTMESLMADETNEQTVTLQELMVSNLAMTDALAKLMIAKGVITDAEFKAQLGTERANYLAMLKRLQ